MSKTLKGKYFPNSSLWKAHHKSSDSWLWSTWLKIILHLKKRVIMSIGDGKNTDIWSDPWIAELQKLSPALEFNSDYLKLKKVCDLLKSNGIAWDKDLIEQSFKPEEAQMILNIPLKPARQILGQVGLRVHSLRKGGEINLP
ncbi:RNA-directed DNA polymerase (reversetranscriptase)-related family protein [Striga asiatica]|uniref:RNA-directed DNA polymerase (Reversetranscriptase)-related family protein n=1 Tax=Striga asiatica TaxID=4170 RepID=A0A5A7PC51_STRAF|nr:RNA-directed DNA polymerase (reversetranscriptase)-related family protein [Striga asiatica]